MDKKTYYITTPIYYPSGKLHIGHSYTTVVSDTMARYKRMQGFDVMFLTGTDEHGQKIETTAAEKGMQPKVYVDDIVEGIKNLWKLMDISYDRFIRTTDDYHVLATQRIFNKLYEKGDIYKSVYKGAYCKPCESFWTDTQLVDGNCPDCHRAVEQAEEESYFFRLSKYTDKILQYYKDCPDFLQPQSRVNEMINNFLKPGLEDLAVSRTSFKWGVPVTFDTGHVIYVWIDALSNYITALGYENDKYNDYQRFWPADLHLMAKEIVRFHSIIWPALLMALGEPLPKKVYGHGWLLFGGDKMSKSKGNVVDPVVLCNRYGVDAVRYFLLREIPFGHDGNFSNISLINRINSDLANDLGNLVSRTVAMVFKYFSGKLPVHRLPQEPLDNELINMALGLKTQTEAFMDNLQFPNALTEIFKFISRANKYIDETTPWVLAKNPENFPRLASVLYNLLESIRISAVLLSPFMPSTAPKIFSQIGAAAENTLWDSAAKFGLLPADVSVSGGENLFPRIDSEKELAELENLGAPSEKPSAAPPQGVAALIDIADFARVELRVAKVLACEPIEKSDKLLKLSLDDGAQGRQVVSGIRQWYAPSDLIGKKIIVVANLKPANLRGVLSEGMILAADTAGGASVIFVADDVPSGAKVR